MENINLNSVQITNYSASIVHEGQDFQVLHVAIHTNENTFLYRVCEDERQRDLNSIREFIEDSFATALREEFDGLLDEYLGRHYIFITHPNGTRNQYTAQRLYPTTI